MYKDRVDKESRYLTKKHDQSLNRNIFKLDQILFTLLLASSKIMKSL